MTSWGEARPDDHRPYLSHSQLNMLSKCAKQYEFRYIDGIRSPPGVAMLIGSGTHASVEQNLGHKMTTGRLLGEDAVAEIAAADTRRRFQQEMPVLTEEEAREGLIVTKGAAVDTAVALAKLHHQKLAPLITPIGVEVGFTLHLPGFPYDLVGYKDVVEANGIRDTKTKGKMPTKAQLEADTQFTIYDMESASRGERPRLTMDVLMRTSRSAAQSLELRRTPLDHQRLLLRVETAALQIERGVFPPTDPTSWACSPKWCGYWDRCDFGGKQKVAVGLIDPSRLTSRSRAAVAELAKESSGEE